MWWKSRTKAVAVALAATGAAVLSGPAAAAAAVSPPATAPDRAGVAVTRTAETGEIGPLSASGCTGRNGPGHINSTCLTVRGTGTLVQTIEGSMESVSFPPRPITLCDVKVHAWGTYAGGARFDRTGTARCSYAGYAYVQWALFTSFAPNSTICVRTHYDGEWSNPACITVR